MTTTAVPDTSGPITDAATADGDQGRAVPRFDSAVRIGSSELAELIAYLGADVVARDADNRHPFAEFEVLRAARLGALRLPIDQGGGGATLPELFETVIALGEADPNIAHSIRNHLNFTESLLRESDGPDARWLDEVRAGKLFGNSSTELSNKRAGRRNQDFESAVTRSDDGLRLNGIKFYSTGNLYADYLVVAVSGPDGKPARVVVPATRPGIVVEQDWDGIGQRFTGSGTTRYVDVAVTEDEFLSNGTYYGDLPYSATFPQLYLTAVIAGILRRVTTDAADLVRTKQRTFYHAVEGHPVDDPILQQTVGTLASTAYAAEALVLSAAQALSEAYAAHGSTDEAELSLRAASRSAKAKVVVDELALRAAGELFDVGGGTAARRSSHLDRHWRNIRTLAAHNPRTYKAKAIGANELTGEPLPTGAFF
ncbi:acyl-CoA dehydrogenase family protein [Gordonia sp. ABSL1-1]|uniref:acyl-CoA dehydrogenase family protein n=1 Tax=Gordonia sp. ABSL1-1 TaxID=3053923 RepID=UPI0025745025|nr:acyl-CoA dehydrogenase family protein [Gordonia sp. ABSL1-1]MDL9937789.1 acyl-CoA dehydrogenase family protein [Gordonia sp. ABSL1-1]